MLFTEILIIISQILVSKKKLNTCQELESLKLLVTVFHPFILIDVENMAAITLHLCLLDKKQSVT